MMYETKIDKVSFSSWRWIFGIGINLLIVVFQPFNTSAQPRETIAQSTTQQATQVVNSNAAQAALEPKILSEINRVRTNPQGYARWLEEQQQYFDGIWLRLPGEKPIRTNKGKKALEEAIAILKEQQPLPPLEISEQTAANATSELENFATANNIQFFSYGRTTATGIVMGLVVDDLFPDRRRRNSLLSPEAENTGVVCKPDPRYAKVCAIAYSDSNIADIAEAEPETTPAPADEPVAETTPAPADEPVVEVEPETTPAPADELVAEAEPETTPQPPTPEPKPEVAPTPQSENAAATTELPRPPQPQAPPTPSVNIPEAESESEDADLARAEAEIDEVQIEEEIETPTTENLEEEEPEAVYENESASDGEDEEAEAESIDSQDEEIAEVEDNSEQVAVNSDSDRLLEQIERGSLEEGDRIIADDGSFYDFYPIEGKKGESYTIRLESDEFDAFVALVDGNGNTVKENDDISQENSNSRIDVTLPEDGTYNVIVNTYDEKGTGQYVLTVTR